MKNLERTETRKNEILDVAENLFFEKGYEHTTINDILNASGRRKRKIFDSFNTRVRKEYSIMKKIYRYKPVRFYGIVFSLTWAFWFAAAIVGHSVADGGDGISLTLMLFGLLVPPVTALVTILLSKSAALKKDLRDKLIGLFRVKPFIVITAIVLFASQYMSL